MAEGSPAFSHLGDDGGSPAPILLAEYSTVPTTLLSCGVPHEAPQCALGSLEECVTFPVAQQPHEAVEQSPVELISLEEDVGCKSTPAWAVLDLIRVAAGI